MVAQTQSARRTHGNEVNRFWSYVIKSDGCWLWDGFINGRGYGQMRVNGVMTGVHRYSFFLHHGYWPEPFCLHSCDVPNCVNPAHLRAGTHRDNMDDKQSRKRIARGSRIGTARLTEADVKQIKQQLVEGASLSHLGTVYGVAKTTISAIKTGSTWSHVQEQI